MSKIMHYPKGVHPYKDLGNQRIPYLPEKNDIVKIGADVGSIAKDTYLLLNGETKILPDTIKDNNDKINITFSVSGFDDGEKVTYQIVNGELESEAYNFTVGKWVEISLEKTYLEDNSICLETDTLDNQLFLGFSNGNIVLSKNKHEWDTMVSTSDNGFQCEDISIDIRNNPFSIDVYSKESLVISNFKLYAFITDKIEKFRSTFYSVNKGIFGLGERFNGVNQLNKEPKNVVFEKFTEQGEITYFPIPIFYSTARYGVFVDTNAHIDYSFAQENVSMTMDMLDDIYIIPGDISKTIKTYTTLTGECNLPPKWTFGTWISANRWNCQRHIDEQIELIKKYNYPTHALVIEAWSDEATFYVFNESEYEPKVGYLSSDEITYKEDGLWTNPKKMIDELHEMGIKVILWQAPMVKKLEEGRYNTQHEIDRKEVVERNYVVKNADGSPYTIPEGYWFGGSYVPDYSNPDASNWVAGKRKHLMDIGIDGFKTDGGEFIYYDDLATDNNADSREIRNEYLYHYEKAFNDMLNDDGVLFSRAGYKGVQQFPIHWAGDQQSLFTEYRAVIKAGLSLGLSGVPFWSFDIGGFANKLPTIELYTRWTSMAVFAPVFQWHSEPTFGQFAEVIKGDGGINDRSPWNMAEYHNDLKVLDMACYYANMRMNLLPYIYQVAEDCAKNSKPMFKHLYYDNQEDENTINIEDEFMLGNLLITPIVHEGEIEREVYLPKGRWENIFTGESFDGKIRISQKNKVDEIAVFIKKGSAIMLNLNNEFKLGESVGNDVDSFINPCVYVSGEMGEYEYSGAGVSCSIKWGNNKVNLVNYSDSDIYVLSHNKVRNLQQVGKTRFNENELYIYKREEG